MISHDLKCIFVHIPRCAGSSIEEWLIGKNWWDIDPKTKHLTASQSKHIYQEYWDDYFKFSVVRQPIDRVLSCLKYSEHFGITFDPEHGLDFSAYHRRFGRRVVVEHDHRFWKRTGIISKAHQEHCVYGNILDEPLDFVATFEALADGMGHVKATLGVDRDFASHTEQSGSKRLGADALSTADVDYVRTMYQADIERYYGAGI